MPLLDDDDIQIHLPADKLKLDNIDDDVEKIKLDTERIIRGTLAGVLEATTLATWLTPATTPPEIRAAGGRLAAALIYRDRYSEDSLDDPQFAQVKYNEGMSMLNAIKAGDITLTDPGTGDPLPDQGVAFDNTFFSPNANTNPPVFTMDAEF